MPRVTKGGMTPLQREFVRQYTAGAEGIRHNASAAYVAAGGKGRNANVIGVSAFHVLNNPKVQARLLAVQREADAQVIAQLVDWKVASTAAQEKLITLTDGVFPGTERRLQDRDDAAVAQVILGALKEILDRGYPKKLKVDVDPRETLAALLGVAQEALPPALAQEEAPP
jgi:hypothetical protein